MTFPKVEERTLYPPIVAYLNSIGLKAIGESKVTTKHPDIVFQKDDVSFVVEIKIGKTRLGLDAVAQAYEYARKLNTNNIVILIFPEHYKKQSIIDPNLVQDIALISEIEAIVLTEYWTERLRDSVINIFSKLKENIEKKSINIDFKTTVELIGTYVQDLISVVNQIRSEALIFEVVNKLDLFSSLSDIKDKELAKKQITNLASYLLFNQLLFYHIYKKKTGNESLPELDTISKISDLQNYIDQILKIDYESIYLVNILGHIPDTKIVIKTLNELILSIKLLRAEHITHDLAGRFFHDLLPHEVRKVLAAFYTHTNAAEILAGLTIESWEDTVIDPACGSGTLLVASYKRKFDLYTKMYGFQDIERVHKKFIEDDITGIDIMPFAAHITTINLTSQNIEYMTNTIRIATRDSLELEDSLRTVDFKENGILFSPFSFKIQRTLEGIFGKAGTGALSPRGKGKEFNLKPVDVVIMNPPFTDRNKMPVEMRTSLKNNPLGKICGHSINFWGYFLVLSDLMIKEKGKIGAVIPINFARGENTKKIRDFLLENYHISYIIKPVGDTAFSEGASFRDILLIAQKNIKEANNFTKIVFIKSSIKEMNTRECSNLWRQIRRIDDEVFINDDFEIWCVNSYALKQARDNLMIYLRGNSIKTRSTIIRFLNLVKEKARGILKKLEKADMLEGFHASPAGLSELVFVTNPFNKNRISRNVIMKVHSEQDNHIEVECDHLTSPFKISKNKLKPAIKTLTGIKSIDVTRKHDYLIQENFRGFDAILPLSKWKGEFDWNLVSKKMNNRSTYFALQHRIRINSPNTSVIGIYSDEPFYVTHAFNIFKSNQEDAKILALFLNSIIGLLQLSSISKETTEGYLEFMQSDLINISVLNLNTLTSDQKSKLVKLFETIKNIEFPSIMIQIGNRFKPRIELDKTILSILGFDETEISEWLPIIYDSLLDELKT